MSLSPLTRPSTSVDVARAAGVSRTTVSRILRGDEAAFPEATRRRVHEAATRLEYRPSSAGRSLVTGRSDTIVVLIPEVPFGRNLQAAVDEIMARSQPYGGNVVVRFASSTSGATLSALETLRPSAVLNMGVLTPEEARRLRDLGSAVVPEQASGDDAHTDGGIARLQVETLKRAGARPIWYVGVKGDHEDPYSAARFAAIQNVCRSDDLPAPQRIDIGMSPVQARAALRQILTGGRPVALACYDDDAAIAALAAARDLGVAVPGEVALVGVNGAPAGQFWSPRLTTITIDVRHYVTALSAELSDRLGWNRTPDDSSVPPLATLLEGETI